jgi:hypothetical protein
MDKLEFDKRRRTVANCPCGKSNKDGKFCPYKGYENKGYCFSCGDVFLPKSETNDGDTWRESDAYKQNYTPSVFADIEPSYIDETTVKKTVQRFNDNHFIEFLAVIFGNNAPILNDLIKRFSIGTALNGKTVFWQRDILGKVRSGQIMLYDATTGKRDRFTNPNWTHVLLKLEAFNLVQCFFGESQLTNDSKPVAIVEAAKTAAIMSPIEPRYTWIATGGANGLTDRKSQVLKGKHVVLYPDLGKFDQWTERADKLKKRLNLDIRVSTFLENYVSTLPENDRLEHVKQGLDIADYALKFDWYNQAKEPKPKTGPLSIDEQILQNMLSKQPLIKDFINCLGLVNAKTIRPFQSI